MGLDVTMANALGVDICQSSEKLVCVKLDFKDGHSRLHLVEESRGSVNGFWHELLHKVEIHFLFLFLRQSKQLRLCGSAGSKEHVPTLSPLE